jgi:hypothetical protein
MLRTVGCALLSLFLLTGWSVAADKAAKNQMVKGTIKLVDANKALLVVNQKVKNETVIRELDIQDTTEFVIKVGGETKEATGKAALLLLEGKEGASVAVKCDKDVKPVKVTVTIKK